MAPSRHSLSERQLHEYVAEAEGHESQVSGVVGYFYAMYRAEVLSRLVGVEGRNILEVGCGEGMMFDGTGIDPVQMDVSMTRVARARELAIWLEGIPSIERVFYPGIESHPQYALARRQQESGGAIVSFIVKGGREAAWRVVDATKILSITANLGDTKTTITHPASTTHARISAEARAAAGIEEGLLRVAVGLESVADLKADLARGLVV